VQEGLAPARASIINSSVFRDGRILNLTANTSSVLAMRQCAASQSYSRIEFVKDLEQILERKDIRSADRAALRVLMKKIRSGQELTHDERQNLWAYVTRYSRNDARPR
jgi:hypothetical protein